MKIAWVTGASGFWGRNVCLSLLRAGWRVRALSRTKPEDVIGWASANGREVAWAPLDLRTLDLEALLAGDAPHALFHCAALISDDLDAMLDVNFRAPVRLIDPTLARMQARGDGRIGVFMGQNARLGLPGLEQFSATQAALWTWAEARQRSLRGTQVTLTLVFPPRAPSRLQGELAARSGRRPKVSRHAGADKLVAAVLAGRRRAGRRPILAGLSTMS